MLLPELQVVILAAGRGSRMTALLGTTIPKCLLPVAGNPLIYYPLKFLAKNGFLGKEVLVIIQDRDDYVRRAIEKVGERVGVAVDTFVVPEDSEDFGTAESLRLALIAKKITTSVLLMPCDIITDVKLIRLMNYHRTYDSDCTVLFVRGLPLPTAKLPGPKYKVKQERDIVGIKPSTSELIYLASEADFEDQMGLPAATLRKNYHFKILTWLTDTHIYLMKKRLVDILVEEKTHSNIKGEFLPALIKRQYEDSTNIKDRFAFYAFMEEDNRCIRINTVPSYTIISKSMEWLRSYYPEDSDNRTKECEIAKSSKLISCILGEQCIIGEKARLNNVLAMDHVEIEDGAQLENCIISSYAKIGSGANLKECLVGPKYQVSSGGRYAQEYLAVMEETYFDDSEN